MFKRSIDQIGEQAEKSTRNIAVSLNVGVIVAAVALLVSVVALVVAVGGKRA